MSLTRQQAVDEILALFKTAWDSTGHGARVKYQNVGELTEPPAGTDPWARVVLTHTGAEQATLTNGAGNRRFERRGIVTVSVFQPAGEGVIGGDTDLADVVRDAYEGQTTAGGVWFRNVAVREIGVDGTWHQINVDLDFIYDEIK